jgi:glyoxylase-like metal-dependent hydrolase (beta-lactamase superfamily II)
MGAVRHRAEHLSAKRAAELSEGLVMPMLKATIVPVTAFEQNCALLWDDDSRRGVVIDPGGDVPRLLARIEQLALTVEMILLTHGHLDHAGGAAELKRKLLAAGQTTTIVGPHLADRFLLEGIAAQAAAYGLTGMEDALPDRWLVEGAVVDVGGVPFEVLHCPGHTPGHVVYVSPQQRLAVVGDVLFRGSIGRTDFAYGDHATLLNSIVRKLLPLGDDIRFLPGHGEASTFGQERRGNPFLAGIAPATEAARSP